MKKNTRLLLVALIPLLMSGLAGAGERYDMTWKQVDKDKALFDDPSSYYEKIGWFKDVLPQDLYEKLTFDKAEMGKLWEEAVGFKAPDVVGTIAPEIKPGTYAHEDKGKYPFKELMPEHYYNRFNPPGAQGVNQMGNYTEIEVVPTRQYYYPVPVAKATIEHMGTTKLDDEGYIQYKTYISGLPFPRPSGEHKARQIFYNYTKNYHDFESAIAYDKTMGVDSRWREDYYFYGIWTAVKTEGRLVMEPLGWFDETAERMEERWIRHAQPLAPRDEYGNVYFATMYTDPTKDPRFFVYVNMLRRIRKMSASDRQDQSVGSDQTYDDTDGISQPLRRDLYPYDLKVVAEREFLVPAVTSTGAQWMSKEEKYLMKDLQFERRPMWVVDMNQQDRNYIYSKRIVYFDRETLDIWLIENYDQKGRLYRTYSTQWAFVPEMGVLTKFNDLMLDFIDVHSTFEPIRYFPAPWLKRDDISVKRLVKTK